MYIHICNNTGLNITCGDKNVDFDNIYKMKINPCAAIFNEAFPNIRTTIITGFVGRVSTQLSLSTIGQQLGDGALLLLFDRPNAIRDNKNHQSDAFAIPTDIEQSPSTHFTHSSYSARPYTTCYICSQSFASSFDLKTHYYRR